MPMADSGHSSVDALSRPLRDLRVSVIETCNYRCPYCMPEGLVPEESTLDRARRLDFAQIETAVRAFARLGVSKIRLTGGEPLLRKGLPELVRRLARIPGIEDLALTTNGSLLAMQAAALRAAGLHRITISLDALDADVFRAMSGGRGDVREVLDGVAAAEAAGFERIKLNTVVQRGVNEDQVLPLVERFRGTPHTLRFIEYMDVGTCNGWRREHRRADRLRHVQGAVARDRDRPSETARETRRQTRYRHGLIVGASLLAIRDTHPSPASWLLLSERARVRTIRSQRRFASDGDQENSRMAAPPAGLGTRIGQYRCCLPALAGFSTYRREGPTGPP